jgi:aspartate kinase
VGLYILKFGGSSVANPQRISHVADIVSRHLQSGTEVVVVTSAMQGVTNQLVDLTKSFGEVMYGREYDAVISSGEQVAAGLLAICLNSIGVKAKSFNAWQIPIIAEGEFSDAAICEINSHKIFEELNDGVVPVITGFQGISKNCKDDILTIGRGGSDATACAIASAMNADKCCIYTDVDGVYTADPRVVLGAKKLAKISYDDMLELADNGAKVLQAKSVAIAKQYGVNLSVLSSFTKGSETLVTNETNYLSNANYEITGISHCVGTIALNTGVISIVGKNPAAQQEVVDFVYRCLCDMSMPFEELITNERRLSIIVPFQQTEEIVNLLHDRIFQISHEN